MNPDNTNGWVRTQQDGAVLTVTLDRPDQLNAQTPATWSTLAQIGSALADELRQRYDGGESIRSLATSTNRSYGFVHRLLSESGATLRSRGGANRNSKKT